MQYKLFTYNISNFDSMPSTMNSEIAGIIHETVLELEPNSIRRDLSNQFMTVFEEHGWIGETNLYFEPARRRTLHYSKNRIHALVSWRHYNMIGTELLKLQTDFVENRIDAGVYICITNELAEMINEISVRADSTNPFDGSITMEKVSEYLQCVSKTITVPLAVMGLIH